MLGLYWVVVRWCTLLGYTTIIPTRENQTEKNLDNGMETTKCLGYVGFRDWVWLLGKIVGLHHKGWFARKTVPNWRGFRL